MAIPRSYYIGKMLSKIFCELTSTDFERVRRFGKEYGLTDAKLVENARKNYLARVKV